ncbi:MAG TPA: acyl-CoA synthetase [Burkholderiales bacterium]|nr:acyl-CoA synthetase [Burkholderiales bacterium]
MLPRLGTYEAVRRQFRWNIGERFNIGVDICDKWAGDAQRLALIYETRDGAVARYTFSQLTRLSNQAANLMRQAGTGRGDRIAILLSQAPETAIAHIAAYKTGAIAVPLFTLFGVDALRFRLADSGAKLLITNREGVAKIAGLRAELPELETVYCIDGAAEGSAAFHEDLARCSDQFEPVRTRADDPALIIYTSGTTGKPKGALHAQRALLGHLPGVEMSHDFLPHAGDLMWTPADWAWIGGLMDLLMPAWHHGIPVLARRFEKFDPEAAFDLMARHRVRNAFLPPTALKLLRHVARPQQRWRFNLRSVASGGESLGAELLEWGREVLGLTINEFYGQTECNMVLSSCGALFPALPGAIGKPAPGHDVGIVDDAGRILPDEEIGNIAVRSPDPVMFLGYWNEAQATRDKYVGEWLITGDTGVSHPGGYVQFVGRNDDVITSAGYRIGPGPIEDCLLSHPCVALAAVVGIPDPDRTQIVKAFVVLKPGFTASETLKRELQDHVKIRLAAHEYPRDVAFVDALPMTTTGKIIRRELRSWSDGHPSR